MSYGVGVTGDGCGLSVERPRVIDLLDPSSTHISRSPWKGKEGLPS